jgi:hypothetical protein
MRIMVSQDVVESLRTLATRLGISRASLLSLASEYAHNYLDDDIRGLLSTQTEPTRITFPDSAPGIMFITETATALGVPVGEVVDLLLREFLPVVLYSPEVRKQAERGHVVMQVHPMLLTKLGDVRAREEVVSELSNAQYITYLIRDLSTAKLTELMVQAGYISDQYDALDWTTMSCPRNLAALITETAHSLDVKRGALFSAFIDVLLHWIRQTNMSAEFVDIIPNDAGIDSHEHFRKTLDYAFSLGFRKIND